VRILGVLKLKYVLLIKLLPFTSSCTWYGVASMFRDTLSAGNASFPQHTCRGTSLPTLCPSSSYVRSPLLLLSLTSQPSTSRSWSPLLRRGRLRELRLQGARAKRGAVAYLGLFSYSSTFTVSNSCSTRHAAGHPSQRYVTTCLTLGPFLFSKVRNRAAPSFPTDRAARPTASASAGLSSVAGLCVEL
jgi:hypothetical protein